MSININEYEELEALFEEHFGDLSSPVYLRSPGRVNLIGEHTDYNEGFVFPSAINLEIFGLAQKRDDLKINVYSKDFNELKSFEIKDKYEKENLWTDYIKGVILELQKIGNLQCGADIVYKSNLPVGSGLSSSASFELINSVLFSYINEINISKKDMAFLCQRAENNFVGVNCGIMDQFSIALGKKGTAIFLDTKTHNYENVDLNLKDISIVIGNTNKPRSLSSSAYNQRRNECKRAVEILKTKFLEINSLRDANLDMLESLKQKMPLEVFKRAYHVITENNRVIESVKFLKEGRLDSFGKLMIDSHNSLKDFYEVSCFELDTMVEEALKVDGVIGSRMTGAGFGGCTVSLVKNSSILEFKEKVGEKYKNKTGLIPDFYVVEPVDGVECFKK